MWYPINKLSMRPATEILYFYIIIPKQNKSCHVWHWWLLRFALLCFLTFKLSQFSVLIYTCVCWRGYKGKYTEFELTCNYWLIACSGKVICKDVHICSDSLHSKGIVTILLHHIYGNYVTGIKFLYIAHYLLFMPFIRLYCCPTSCKWLLWCAQ